MQWVFYILFILMFGCGSSGDDLSGLSQEPESPSSPSSPSAPSTQTLSLSILSPPNYYSFIPPLVGLSYSDSVFGTSIKRLSNAPMTLDASQGVGFVTQIVNEYATMSPFNSDSSKLLLIHQSYFALYDGNGNFIRNLPFAISASSEPRWSRSSPNVIYYHHDNSLEQYNVSTNITSAVSTFGEYSVISGKGESDICFDGNHFVLMGDNHDIFVYEISTNSKGPVLNTAGLGEIDNLYITSNDNVLVGWLASGSGRYHGIEMYDRSMRFVRQVAPVVGHMDVTRDVDGQEVLLWINAADPRPIAPNAVVKIILATGQQIPLVSFDWSLAVHISAPDGNGWFFVETYSVSDPAPGTSAWNLYTNELLKVKLDGSEVRRLAHHRSRPFNNYYWQPRAATNRQGTRLVFSSNYGLSSILGYPVDYSDGYLIVE